MQGPMAPFGKAGGRKVVIVISIMALNPWSVPQSARIGEWQETSERLKQTNGEVVGLARWRRVPWVSSRTFV
jgi:hypothetical protein